MKIVVWLGSLGALLGAMGGLVDNDIKRIVALSTLSQLGYKVVAVGLSQYNLALFHLLMHAFFKSTLFLASGAILHAFKDNQNISRKGSSNLLLPFTYLIFLFASLSLMAFPFTSGFYSKDFLLELLCVPHHFTHTIAYIFTLLAALLTSTYSIRVKMIAMLSRPLFPRTMLPFVVDSPLLKTGPLLILTTAAVILGFFTNEIFLSFGSSFYLNSIFTHPNTHTFLFDASFGGSLISLIPVTFLLLFSLLFFISPSSPSSSTLSPLGPKISLQIHSKPLSTPFNFTSDFYLLNAFNVFFHWVMYLFFLLSNFSFRYLDKGFLEFFGPLGLLKFFHYFGLHLELFSTGFIPHYAYITTSFIFLFLSTLFILF